MYKHLNSITINILLKVNTIEIENVCTCGCANLYKVFFIYWYYFMHWIFIPINFVVVQVTKVKLFFSYIKLMTYYWSSWGKWGRSRAATVRTVKWCVLTKCLWLTRSSLGMRALLLVLRCITLLVVFSLLTFCSGCL